MISELYTRAPCIFLLSEPGEFQCHEDQAVGPRAHLQDLSAFCLPLAFFSTVQWECLTLI